MSSPAAAPRSGSEVDAALAIFEGRIRRDAHHRYKVRCDDGVWRTAPGVTRILSCLGKDALVGWAAFAQYFVDVETAWKLYADEPRGWPRWKFDAVFQAEAGAQRAHEKILVAATDHGTMVHNAIEAFLCGRPHVDGLQTDAARDGFDVWRAWWRSAELAPVAVEKAVAYFENGLPTYTGTFDLLARRRDDTLVVIDWKTSKTIGHPEQRLQSVAYRAALAQAGAPMPDGMLVRVPRCSTSRVEVLEVDDDVNDTFAAFLALARVHAWSTEC
jgi:hypothetical protein